MNYFIISYFLNLSVFFICTFQFNDTYVVIDIKWSFLGDNTQNCHFIACNNSIQLIIKVFFTRDCINFTRCTYNIILLIKNRSLVILYTFRHFYVAEWWKLIKFHRYIDNHLLLFQLISNLTKFTRTIIKLSNNHLLIIIDYNRLYKRWFNLIKIFQ